MSQFFINSLNKQLGGKEDELFGAFGGLSGLGIDGDFYKDDSDSQKEDKSDKGSQYSGEGEDFYDFEGSSDSGSISSEDQKSKASQDGKENSEMFDELENELNEKPSDDKLDIQNQDDQFQRGKIDYDDDKGDDKGSQDGSEDMDMDIDLINELEQALDEEKDEDQDESLRKEMFDSLDQDKSASALKSPNKSQGLKIKTKDGLQQTDQKEQQQRRDLIQKFEQQNVQKKKQAAPKLQAQAKLVIPYAGIVESGGYQQKIVKFSQIFGTEVSQLPEYQAQLKSKQNRLENARDRLMEDIIESQFNAQMEQGMIILACETQFGTTNQQGSNLRTTESMENEDEQLKNQWPEKLTNQFYKGRQIFHLDLQQFKDQNNQMDLYQTQSKSEQNLVQKSQSQSKQILQKQISIGQTQNELDKLRLNQQKDELQKIMQPFNIFSWESQIDWGQKDQSQKPIQFNEDQQNDSEMSTQEKIDPNIFDNNDSTKQQIQANYNSQKIELSFDGINQADYLATGQQVRSQSWNYDQIFDSDKFDTQVPQSPQLQVNLNDPYQVVEVQNEDTAKDLQAKAIAKIQKSQGQFDFTLGQVDNVEDLEAQLGVLNLTVERKFEQVDRLLIAQDVKSSFNHSILAQNLQLLPILTNLEDYLNLHTPIAQFPILTDRQNTKFDEGLMQNSLKKIHSSFKRPNPDDVYYHLTFKGPYVNKSRIRILAGIQSHNNKPLDVWVQIHLEEGIGEGEGELDQIPSFYAGKPLAQVDGKLKLQSIFKRFAPKYPPLGAVLHTQFTYGKILNNTVVLQTPNLTSLEPPEAFKSKQELQASSPGKVYVLEYMEEHPHVQNQSGMSLKFLTYYRKKSQEDNSWHNIINQRQQNEEEAWKYGAVLPINPEDSGPFLGEIKQGEQFQAFECNMYRQPAFAHQRQENDFLLIRNQNGSWRIRHFQGSYTMGQQHPLQKITNPSQTSDLMKYEEKRVITFAYQVLITKQQAFDEKRKSGKNVSQDTVYVSNEEVRKMFPYLSENQVNLRMKKAKFVSLRGRPHWTLEKGQAVPTPALIASELPCEEVCLYEAMHTYRALCQLHGVRRINDWNITNNLMNYDVLLNLAVYHMLPFERNYKAALLVENLVCGFPWNLTENYISKIIQGQTHDYGRGMKWDLAVDGVGDPTGRGLGISFARKERRKQQGDRDVGSYKDKLYKERDVKETELELLKALPKEELDNLLLDIGLSEAEIANITRLNKLRMIHKLGRAAMRDNNKALYSKLQKYFNKEEFKVQSYSKGKMQQIFDQQREVLGEGEVVEDSPYELNSQLPNNFGYDQVLSNNYGPMKKLEKFLEEQDFNESEFREIDLGTRTLGKQKVPTANARRTKRKVTMRVSETVIVKFELVFEGEFNDALLQIHGRDYVGKRVLLGPQEGTKNQNWMQLRGPKARQTLPELKLNQMKAQQGKEEELEGDSLGEEGEQGDQTDRSKREGEEGVQEGEIIDKSKQRKDKKPSALESPRIILRKENEKIVKTATRTIKKAQYGYDQDQFVQDFLIDDSDDERHRKSRSGSPAIDPDHIREEGEEDEGDEGDGDRDDEGEDEGETRRVRKSTRVRKQTLAMQEAAEQEGPAARETRRRGLRSNPNLDQPHTPQATANSDLYQVGADGKGAISGRRAKGRGEDGELEQEEYGTRKRSRKSKRSLDEIGSEPSKAEDKDPDFDYKGKKRRRLRSPSLSDLSENYSTSIRQGNRRSRGRKQISLQYEDEDEEDEGEYQSRNKKEKQEGSWMESWGSDGGGKRNRKGKRIQEVSSDVGEKQQKKKQSKRIQKKEQDLEDLKQEMEQQYEEEVLDSEIATQETEISGKTRDEITQDKQKREKVKTRRKEKYQDVEEEDSLLSEPIRKRSHSQKSIKDGEEEEDIPLFQRIKNQKQGKGKNKGKRKRTTDKSATPTKKPSTRPTRHSQRIDSKNFDKGELKQEENFATLQNPDELNMLLDDNNQQYITGQNTSVIEQNSKFDKLMKQRNQISQAPRQSYKDKQNNNNNNNNDYNEYARYKDEQYETNNSIQQDQMDESPQRQKETVRQHEDQQLQQQQQFNDDDDDDDDDDKQFQIPQTAEQFDQMYSEYDNNDDYNFTNNQTKYGQVDPQDQQNIIDEGLLKNDVFANDNDATKRGPKLKLKLRPGAKKGDNNVQKTPQKTPVQNNARQLNNRRYDVASPQLHAQINNAETPNQLQFQQQLKQENSQQPGFNSFQQQQQPIKKEEYMQQQYQQNLPQYQQQQNQIQQQMPGRPQAQQNQQNKNYAQQIPDQQAYQQKMHQNKQRPQQFQGQQQIQQQQYWQQQQLQQSQRQGGTAPPIQQAHLQKNSNLLGNQQSINNVHADRNQSLVMSNHEFAGDTNIVSQKGQFNSNIQGQYPPRGIKQQPISPNTTVQTQTSRLEGTKQHPRKSKGQGLQQKQGQPQNHLQKQQEQLLNQWGQQNMQQQKLMGQNQQGHGQGAFNTQEQQQMQGGSKMGASPQKAPPSKKRKSENIDFNMKDKVVQQYIRNLNSQLKNIVKILRQVDGGINFKQPVSKLMVSDYNQWVKPADEMWIDKIMAKCSANKYKEVQQFRDDVQQIVINAINYSSPGHGKMGDIAIISQAQGLQKVSEQETMKLEQNIVVPKKEKIVKQAVEKEEWVKCDGCKKWRNISVDVKERTVLPKQKWYCRMNFERPNASCEQVDDQHFLQK